MSTVSLVVEGYTTDFEELRVRLEMLGYYRVRYGRTLTGEKRKARENGATDEIDEASDSPETLEETIMRWTQPYSYPPAAKQVRVTHFSQIEHFLEKETKILNALPEAFAGYVRVVKSERAVLRGRRVVDALKALDLVEKCKVKRTVWRFRSRDGRCTLEAFRLPLERLDSPEMHLLRIARSVVSEAEPATMRAEAEEHVKFIEGLRPYLEVLLESS